MEIEDLLRDLIKIPSPSGEESEIGEFIANRLKSNFKVVKQKVENRFNILAYNKKPEIILTTHLDTVPKQLEVREDNEYFYGRGACDAKASIVSMIIAAERLVKQGITNIGLLFDVSEEDDFSGIKKAVSLVNPKFVIVGEPTDFNIVIGQKGLLRIKIKCFGKSAPGSTPEKGVSAINKLVNQLNKMIFKKWPVSKLGKTSFNIGRISGGSAANVVADYAEAVVEFRTVSDNELIIKMLKELCMTFEIIYSYSPSFLVEDNLVKDMGVNKIIVPYFTEMYFWNKKASCIVFGPGKYEFAHSDNEKIAKVDLKKAVEKYIQILTYLNNQNLNNNKKGDEK